MPVTRSSSSKLGFIEPSTPAKTIEHSSPNSTDSTRRRRSLRFSSSRSGDVTDSPITPSRKRSRNLDDSGTGKHSELVNVEIRNDASYVYVSDSENEDEVSVEVPVDVKDEVRSGFSVSRRKKGKRGSGSRKNDGGCEFEIEVSVDIPVDVIRELECKDEVRSGSGVSRKIRGKRGSSNCGKEGEGELYRNLRSGSRRNGGGVDVSAVEVETEVEEKRGEREGDGYLNLRSGLRRNGGCVDVSAFEVETEVEEKKEEREGDGYLNLRSGSRRNVGGVDVVEVRTEIEEKEEREGDGYLNLRSGSRRNVGGVDVVVVRTEIEEKEEREGDGYLNLKSGSRGNAGGVEMVEVEKEVEEKRGEDGVIGVENEEKGKSVVIEGEKKGIDVSGSQSRRFTREEKGKGVVMEEDTGVNTDEKDLMDELDVRLGNPDMDLNLLPRDEENEDFVEDSDADDVPPAFVVERVILEGVQPVARAGENADRVKSRMDRFKDIAKRDASKYAHFSGQEEEDEENGVDSEDEEEKLASEQPAQNAEDWPGPFSTAMKIVRDREKNLNAQVRKCSDEGGFPLITWTPRTDGYAHRGKRVPRSLQDMCLDVLSKNVDAITSLNYVPDVQRNKLSQMLCDSRSMNVHFLGLLLDGSPSEVRLPDCSWLEEDKFEKSFEGCDTSHLTVLQLDLCGHCVSDSSLRKAFLPKGLPALTSISLKGACRISDLGLSSLVSCAPALRSINLAQCSLLTDDGVRNVANSLGPILRELYLDDCVDMNAMQILPALKSLTRLEVLSLRGISSVTDKFMKRFISSNGQNLKELLLANCGKLSDSTLKVIAENCSKLCVLDLSHLSKLTDIGMAHLANGCREIQDLKLCRSRGAFSFSDDAIAAFLETAGKSLQELSLNNNAKVGQHTTLSLARCCKNLQRLDLSWCRMLTDEALGFIADSCLSLRVLKLFGCSQVTRIFLDGHSNPDLHVIGMKLTPILQHLKRPDFQQGPLHYSVVPSV